MFLKVNAFLKINFNEYNQGKNILVKKENIDGNFFTKNQRLQKL